MYGRELETVKRLLHDVVIYQDIDSLMKLRDLLNDNTIEIPTGDDWNTRRLSNMRCIKQRGHIRGNGGLQNLQRVQNLERLQNLDIIKRIENISTVNVSFSDVAIITPFDETIVYMDPPYIGTGGVSTYKEQCSHDALYDYMRNSKYTCFMSEYTAPFEEVWSKDVRCQLNTNKHGNYKQATERLFINRYPDDYNPQPTQGSLLDLSIKK